jgi:hypothetical protein
MVNLYGLSVQEMTTDMFHFLETLPGPFSFWVCVTVPDHLNSPRVLVCVTVPDHQSSPRVLGSCYRSAPPELTQGFGFVLPFRTTRVHPRFWVRVTVRVTIPDHLSSPRALGSWYRSGPPEFTQGLGLCYRSGPPEFTKDFWVRGDRSLLYSVVFCKSLFGLLFFFFWSLSYLCFFDLRIFITPLVSSNSSHG